MTYYWRVNAINPAGPSPWSDTRSFILTFDTKPIAYWSFDSSSGNTYYDMTGHGYNAIATGTGVGLAAGIKGQALSCSGNGFEITASNSNNDFNLTQFTVESWVSVGQNLSQQPENVKILDYSSVAPSGGSTNGFSTFVVPDWTMGMSSGTSSGIGWNLTLSSTKLTSQTWCHVAYTYDSSSMKIYVNGVLSGTSNHLGPYIKPIYDAHIACMRRTGNVVTACYNGLIDELKLYGYALSPDTLLAHYMDGLNSAIMGAQNKPVHPSTLMVRARNSSLTISLPSAMMGKPIDLAVYTASGREIVRKTVMSVSGKFTIPIPGLSGGAYVLTVKDGNLKVLKATTRFAVVR
jgi:hypothetical protein